MSDSKVPSELVHKYGWVNEIEAWTVAVIADRTPADVVRAYGGDIEDAVGEYSFGQLMDLQGTDPSALRHHVQFIVQDNRTIALENNGWSGSHAEIARRCSRNNGHFLSVYWNVNAFGMVTEAKNGEITASFESLYPTAPDAAPGEFRPQWALGPETPVEEAWQTCVALLDQQTGVALDPSWLGRKRPTYRIPDPHSLYPEEQS